MEFPIYNISEEAWLSSRIGIHDILFENPYPCLKLFSNKKFSENNRSSIYVDCKGDIYKITGFTFHKNGGIGKLFPFIGKMELHFIETDEYCSFEDFKELIIERTVETKDEEFEKIARNATSFKDMYLPIKK